MWIYRAPFRVNSIIGIREITINKSRRLALLLSVLVVTHNVHGNCADWFVHVSHIFSKWDSDKRSIVAPNVAA